MFKLGLLILSLQVVLTGCTGNFREASGLGGAQGKPGATTSITFEEIKTQILQKNCIECHEGKHNDYDQYRVVRGSSVTMLARMTTADVTRRMPDGGPALDPKLIAMFREWVEAGAPEFGSVEAEPDLGEPVSFLEVKTNVLEKYNCTTCHSQYNDYETARGKSGSMFSLMGTDDLSRRMPFSAKQNRELDPDKLPEPVSAEDLELFGRWLDQGSPEFADEDPAPIQEVVLEPTWESIRNNIVGPKCILCHNSLGERAPVAFSSLAQLKVYAEGYLEGEVNGRGEQPLLFDFVDPIRSHFIASMLGRTDDDTGEDNLEFFYDAMPWNRGDDGDLLTELDPVTPEELEVIQEWIGTNLQREFEELENDPQLQNEIEIIKLKNLGKNII